MPSSTIITRDTPVSSSWSVLCSPPSKKAASIGMALLFAASGAAWWMAYRRRQALYRHKTADVVLHSDHGDHSHNRPPAPIITPSDDIQPALTSPTEEDDHVDPEDRRRALELFHTLKTQGNHAFSKGSMHDALKSYQDALDVVSMLPSAKDPELQGLANVVRANVMMVLLKMECYDDVRMLGTYLLQPDSDAVNPPNLSSSQSHHQHLHMPQDLVCKVLFRRAAAMVHLGDLEGALSDLRAAKKLSLKADPAIESELKRVEKLASSH